jgi:hypothetical protein
MSSEAETSLGVSRTIKDSSTSLGMTTELFLFDGSDRHRSNAFTAAQRPETLICRCFDADTWLRNCDRRSNLLSHRRNVRRNLRLFRNDRCIDIHHARLLFSEEGCNTFQNVDAANAANRFISVRKMLPDVTGADGAEHRVCNRMRKNVSVRMSLQAAWIRNWDPAENQLSIFARR